MAIPFIIGLLVGACLGYMICGFLTTNERKGNEND